MKKRVIVVGAGLAGLSAAIRLADSGAECLLVSSQPSERAQSALAEGGINAALNTMGEGDRPSLHMEDTLRGGADLADPAAVAGLTEAAPEIVRGLLAAGAALCLQADGSPLLRSFGGQKKKRTAFAQSSTGKILMSAMIDEARKREAAGGIRRLAHHDALRVAIGREGCAGAWLRDGFSGAVSFVPGQVVLACGGLNGFFPGNTTGTTLNTGDLAASLFSQGVEFANLEFLQYHPTTVRIPGKRLLVSEAARGEGGRLFVLREGRPWYFMEELYPEMGNLMPRDVVSRTMTEICAREDCGGQAYLDLRGISGQIWRERLADMRTELREHLALDPAKEPIPVEPGIHFFMGGVRVDAAHRTTVPGLYAAGECACQYHGANRLGGNSMLAALYSGGLAALSALEDGWAPCGDGPAPEVSIRREGRTEAMGAILLAGLGVLRSGTAIEAALERLDSFAGAEDLTAVERERARLGRAMLLSALERRESRGAHVRTDCPQRDDERFRRTTVAALREGRVSVRFEPVPSGKGDGR